MKKQVIVTGLMLALFATGFAAPGEGNQAAEAKCKEGVYKSERDRGESHQSARDHAKEVCKPDKD